MAEPDHRVQLLNDKVDSARKKGGVCVCVLVDRLLEQHAKEQTEKNTWSGLIRIPTQTFHNT